MNASLAIGTAPVNAVAAEAASLREFVVQQRPALGCELGPVTLEPEAPDPVRRSGRPSAGPTGWTRRGGCRGRMRRLWAVLGHSHATAKLRPVTREESRARLVRIVKDWHKDHWSRRVWGVAGGPTDYLAAVEPDER
jgi:hypothetical protein